MNNDGIKCPTITAKTEQKDAVPTSTFSHFQNIASISSLSSSSTTTTFQQQQQQQQKQQQQKQQQQETVDAIVKPTSKTRKTVARTVTPPIQQQQQKSSSNINNSNNNNNNMMMTMRPFRKRRTNSRRNYKSLNNHKDPIVSPPPTNGPPGRNISSPMVVRNKKKEYKPLSSPTNKKNCNKYGTKGHSSMKHKRRNNAGTTNATTTSSSCQKSKDCHLTLFKNPSMPNSERTIMIDHTCSSDGDGIELEYKDEIGFLELTHVMAVSGGGPMTNGIECFKSAFIDHGHTVPLKWKVGLDVQYHPVCDFYHRHRFMNACAAATTTTTTTTTTLDARRKPLDDLSSNGEQQGGNSHVMKGVSFNHNAALKEQLEERLRHYNAFVPERELLAREMTSLNRELHVIEMSMETLNQSSRFYYRPCSTSTSCCSESYWDWDEELEVISEKSKKKGLRKLHRKGWNKNVVKENAVHPNQDLEKIRYLQGRRGICFTGAFSDKMTRNEFGHYISGGKANFNEKTGGVHPELVHCKTEIFGLEKVGVISPSIRSICITKNDEGKVGFFVSHDDNETYGGNDIPQRLKARIQKESKSKQSSIRYLALGPRDSYFAELVSGETFWAIGKHDEQFSNIMRSSRVHRVAFGTFKDDSSWIVLTKDGTVAWRNIPLQLEKLLEERQSGMAAPCEVSLGDAGTFFIRFMNGEINYCLPFFADEMCRRIEGAGASISCIFLHPEVMDAIMIRHTELSN